MTIRDADIADAKELLEIYSPYVTNTAISFEYEVPSVEEFENRIRKIKEKYVYLIAKEQGKIIGYCYANTFHARKAYDRSVEVSIYIRNGYKRKGTGRLLYHALEERLRKRGVKNMYACIAYPREEDKFLTKDSVLFHEKMGFIKCGHFHQCGSKFGHWYDMVYMEKLLDK